jgi:hypothetical protein
MEDKQIAIENACGTKEREKSRPPKVAIQQGRSITVSLPVM